MNATLYCKICGVALFDIPDSWVKHGYTTHNFTKQEMSRVVERAPEE